MRSVAKRIAFLGLTALALVAVWRVIVIGMSEYFASDSPQRALEWDAGNPAALLALAQAQLDQGALADAQETAQRLLSREPLNGRGFVVLAEVARMQGDRLLTIQLSTIALRHEPQALGPRAWLAGEDLAQARYADALDGIDRILRVSPGQSARLFPVLIELANNPEFADALAIKLAGQPAWRNGFLNSLLNKAGSDAIDRVLSALQRHGALDLAAKGRWIDRLAQDGAWGEAYALWVGTIEQAHPTRLGYVFNGGFETQPSATGFDWRIGDSAGVIIDRTSPPGANGAHAVGLMFLGRRVEVIPLHQWLLLGAGPYRLSFRAMAEDLRSDRGVQWHIRCQQSGKELMVSEHLGGSFHWKEQGIDFEVPDQECLAQDLWLGNSGTDGPGKVIHGSISFDDFAIERIENHALPGVTRNAHR